MSLRAAALCLSIAIVPSLGAEPNRPAGPTLAGVLTAASDTDWRALDPDNTLYLELEHGRVVIEMAPQFAPAHVENIRQLARQGYWDGLAIVRVQENYVVQWADPDASDSERRRSLGEVKLSLPAEFARAAAGLSFTTSPDGDVYAREVGWVDGFAVGREGADGQAWLAHCYGLVGAGRDLAADSSNGSQLYVVIGHAPRHLDNNITSVGRVVQGMELLSTLPRGSGALGFYEQSEQRVPIQALRLASDLPAEQRVALQVLRTDTETFRQLIESRRNRHEDWFVEPVGKVELCNVPVPVRQAPSAPTAPAEADEQQG